MTLHKLKGLFQLDLNVTSVCASDLTRQPNDLKIDFRSQTLTTRLADFVTQVGDFIRLLRYNILQPCCPFRLC